MKRVGIVGCGGIARVHARSLGELEGCEVSALCDIDLKAAGALARECGADGAVLYDSFDELIKRGEADVLHICTPHHLHVPMAAQALERGLSVFMEKPAAISKEELAALGKAEEASAGRLGVCFQNRYNASTKKLDELTASGKVGRVLGGRAFVTWRRDEDYYAESPWKGRWETEGGGALINQSVHTLDLLLRYLGEPERVEATISNHHTKDRIEVEDTVEAWLAFPGGKRGCFYASNGYVTDAPVCLELQCEKGRLLMTDGVILISGDEGVETVSCKEQAGIGKSYWGAGHLACIRDFYECLESGRRFENDFLGVYNTARTALEIYEKGRERGWNR